MGLLIPGHVPRCPGGIGPDRDVVPASLKSEGHVTYDLCILPEAPHKPTNAQNSPRLPLHSHQCHSPSPVPWAPEAGRPCDDTLFPGSGHGSPGLCWQSPRPGTDFCWSSWPSCTGTARYRRERPDGIPLPTAKKPDLLHSPGPVAPQTLCAHCWTRAPSWSPAGSWG